MTTEQQVSSAIDSLKEAMQAMIDLGFMVEDNEDE